MDERSALIGIIYPIQGGANEGTLATPLLSALADSAAYSLPAQRCCIWFIYQIQQAVKEKVHSS